MRLSEIQGQIIAHLQMNGEIHFKELAKKLNAREHRVRYAFNNLLRSHILRKVPRIELSRLGFFYMHVFFSVRAAQRATTKQLLAKLAHTEGVVFLAELGGEFHYELIAAVKRPAQLTDLFSGKLEDLVTNHAISTSRTYEFYPKNYLAPGNPSASIISIEHDCETHAIDLVDQNILRTLASPSCDSLREASRILGLPFATLRTRIEKLRQKRILGGFLYDSDPLDFNYNEFILLLYTKGLGASLEKELFASAKKHPHITYARSLIGEWNFEIGIEVQQAEDVVRVIDEFTSKLSEEVIKTRLMQRFRALQYRPYPF